MGDPSPLPEGQRYLPGKGNQSGQAATIGLAAAALALGMTLAEAQDLVKRGEFPCDVKRSGDEDRVVFASLVRILRSRADRERRRKDAAENGEAAQ